MFSKIILNKNTNLFRYFTIYSFPIRIFAEKTPFTNLEPVSCRNQLHSFSGLVGNRPPTPTPPPMSPIAPLVEAIGSGHPSILIGCNYDLWAVVMCSEFPSN